MDKSLILKLEVAAELADPARKPLAVAALAVARAAGAEVETANARADDLEKQLAASRGEFASVAKRAAAAEDAALRMEESAAARSVRDLVERRQLGLKRDATAGEAASIAKLAVAVADLVPTVEIFCAAVNHVRDEDGLTILENRAEFGHWLVTNPEGRVVATTEKRSEAIRLVADLLEIERKADPDDDEAPRPDEVEPRGFRPPRPAGSPRGFLPDDLGGLGDPRAAGGRLDGRKIKKLVTKRQARLL